jgi:polyhydroxyalkanoate synthase
VYKENRLARGLLRLRGGRVDLGRIRQPLLIVTADADHIAPPANTVPLLDLVASTDVTHFARPGGHIGLMAGSKARGQIWPDLTRWLSGRSEERRWPPQRQAEAASAPAPPRSTPKAA